MNKNIEKKKKKENNRRMITYIATQNIRGIGHSLENAQFQEYLNRKSNKKYHLFGFTEPNINWNEDRVFRNVQKTFRQCATAISLNERKFMSLTELTCYYTLGQNLFSICIKIFIPIWFHECFENISI